MWFSSYVTTTAATAGVFRLEVRSYFCIFKLHWRLKFSRKITARTLQKKCRCLKCIQVNSISWLKGALCRHFNQERKIFTDLKGAVCKKSGILSLIPDSTKTDRSTKTTFFFVMVRRCSLPFHKGTPCFFYLQSETSRRCSALWMRVAHQSRLLAEITRLTAVVCYFDMLPLIWWPFFFFSFYILHL